ncbi:MAG: hypothetical protein LBH96_04115 [Candidatus Peribacteria bacterium]|jgi:hypothetical protein|nr:hypothetical protein [Candidatus Peribacteria bacterium]
MMATNILDYNSLDKNVKHSSLLISNKASDDLYATFMNNIKIDGIDSKNFTERQAFEFLKDDIVLSIDFLLQE